MRADNAGGLLWFDDDARRPIQEKIAEAAQRYRERVGYEPTVCQLNPAQASVLESGSTPGAARPKRGSANVKPVAPPVDLRLVPTDRIQPHCYLITIGEGETPKPATLPYRDEDEPRPARVAAAERASRSYRLGRAPKIAPATIAPATIAPATIAPAKATRATSVATAKRAAQATARPVASAPVPAATKANGKAPALAAPPAKAPAPSAAMVKASASAKIAPAPATVKPKTSTRRAASQEPTQKRVPAAPKVTAKVTAKAAVPTKVDVPAKTKKAARFPVAQQPTLMTAPAEKVARPAKTKSQSPSITPATPVAAVASTRRAAKRTPSTQGFQAPTLPLIEVEAPRPRRTRKHVA